MLRPMVELELMLLPPVLVSNAKDLLRRNHIALLSIVVILKPGLTTAIQVEIHWLKLVSKTELSTQEADDRSVSTHFVLRFTH